MTELTLPGCRTTPLGGYLAALGCAVLSPAGRRAIGDVGSRNVLISSRRSLDTVTAGGRSRRSLVSP